MRTREHNSTTTVKHIQETSCIASFRRRRDGRRFGSVHVESDPRTSNTDTSSNYSSGAEPLVVVFGMTEESRKSLEKLYDRRRNQ